MLRWLIIWSPGALLGNSKYSIIIFRKSRANLKIADQNPERSPEKNQVSKISQESQILFDGIKKSQTLQTCQTLKICQGRKLLARLRNFA